MTVVLTHLFKLLSFFILIFVSFDTKHGLNLLLVEHMRQLGSYVCLLDSPPSVMLTLGLLSKYETPHYN